MGLCLSSAREKQHTYLDILPENLQILLWNFRYFKTNQINFNINNHDNCPCYLIQNNEKIKTVISNKILEIDNLYSTNNYWDYNILGGNIRETTDLVYSTKNGQYVLLKCYHLTFKDKYLSSCTQYNTRIQLSFTYLTRPYSLDIYGDCIFYITSDPYNFKSYFSNDLLY